MLVCTKSWGTNTEPDKVMNSLDSMLMTAVEVQFEVHTKVRLTDDNVHLDRKSSTTMGDFGADSK